MSTKSYTTGTHRLVDPVETLTRIYPHLAAVGVTRCADVTGLDHLGIPVYCVIRPAALTVQVTNGKGLRPVDALVSGLMEAIELHHAEHPRARSLRRSSLRALRTGAIDALDPAELPGFRSDAFFSADYEIDWVRGTHLRRGAPVWVPASAVHLCWPALYDFSSNGLASGNDLCEATLHALYEVLERDAISRLTHHGTLAIAQRCEILDVASIDDPVLTALTGALRRGGTKLVLLTVPSPAEVTTCWAAILDPRPFASSSMINVGFGTHLSPSVAASRAITEAAQARLTIIHGSRDDLIPDLYRSEKTQTRLWAYFDALRPTCRWQDLPDRSTPTLTTDRDLVLGALDHPEFETVIGVELTRPPFNIPVVKVLVPGLAMNNRLF
jgi:ribosomal protein S12 methylthiotransferase accessory factor